MNHEETDNKLSVMEKPTNDVFLQVVDSLIVSPAEMASSSNGNDAINGSGGGGGGGGRSPNSCQSNEEGSVVSSSSRVSVVAILW